jgi:hypothetical protein
MMGRAPIRQGGKTATVQLKPSGPNMTIGKAEAELAPLVMLASAIALWMFNQRFPNSPKTPATI